MLASLTPPAQVSPPAQSPGHLSARRLDSPQQIPRHPAPNAAGRSATIPIPWVPPPTRGQTNKTFREYNDARELLLDYYVRRRFVPPEVVESIEDNPVVDESLFFDTDQHPIVPNRGVPSAFYLRGIGRGDALSRYEQCPTPERASASSGCPILPIWPESSLLE